jgi:hypothetical protein
MLINHGPGHITPQPSSASCRRPANSRMTQAPSIPPLHSRSVLLRRFPYPITIQRRCCMRILTHPSFSFRARALGRHFCVYFLTTLYRGDCSYSIYVGLRSGIAPCAGLRAQISRGDCIISGSGYLRNIHSVHRVSCSSPPTAGLS